MCTTNIGVKKFVQIITLLVVPLLIIPATILGGETYKESIEESKAQSDFALIIKDNLISLEAKDASLKEIVEEIGSRMKIDVITKIPEEKKINTKFDQLPLEAAIERLRQFADIAYIKDSESDDAKITKILVFPKGKAEELSKSGVSAGEEPVEEALEVEAEEEEALEEESSRWEPFKFEFDPSEF